MRYIQVVLGQLNTTIGMPAHSPQQAEKIAQLQGQFCGMLQVCMERLCRTDDSKAALLPYADQVGGGRIGAFGTWLPDQETANGLGHGLPSYLISDLWRPGAWSPGLHSVLTLNARSCVARHPVPSPHVPCKCACTTRPHLRSPLILNLSPLLALASPPHVRRSWRRCSRCWRARRAAWGCTRRPCWRPAPSRWRWGRTSKSTCRSSPPSCTRACGTTRSGRCACWAGADCRNAVHS